MSRASEYASQAARIIQAKGDAIAQGKLQSGNILGSTIATLGQQIPAAVQDVMRRNAEKRKTEQIQGILQKHPEDLDSAANEIMGIDRDLGMKLLDQNMQAKRFAMEASKFDDEMKQRKQMMLLKPFLSATNADEWDQARLNAKVAGADIPYIGMEFSDDARKRVLMDQMTPQQQIDRLYPEPEKQGGQWIETVGPDGKVGKVYQPNVPGAFVESPPKSATTGDVTLGSFEDYIIRYARDVAKKPVEALTAKEVENARKLYQQADDRPITVNTGAADQRQFSMEQRLVGQWDKANTPQKEMRRQLGLMETGLKRFRTGDKNGGAQAVLVTFQKILDPTSVVRESEYARTAYGQSLINRIEGYAQKLGAGGAGLTDKEMAAMVQTSREFLSGMDTYTAGLRERINRTAQEYKLDPRLIFDDVGAPASAPGAAPRTKPRVDPFAPKPK